MDNVINRACPICDEKVTEPFIAKQNFQLVRCTRCSMIYTNPVPAEMATGAFYDKAGSEYLSPEKLESDYADVRFERELRLFRAYCHRGSVLDVGCSSGAFLYQLKKRFPNDYKILGTDVSKAPLEHAAKMGVPVARGEFLSQTFEEKFDAVTFWAVMEHLSNPKLFLKKAASILKPGGCCFILTPNMDSLAIWLLGAKYRYIFAEHLNYFSPKTMKTFLELEFAVAGIKSTHFNPLVIWQDFHGGEREIPRAERVKLLKRTTGYKQSPWMLPIKVAYRATEVALGTFSMADNVAIVGRKK
jgi:2-polyprenyl-3-methyl-5-hydroxy-6-metoxy-1,4-benzoquinol methylase